METKKKLTLTACLALGLLSFQTGAWALETSFEQDSSLPIVYLNVAVKDGSASDPEGASGLTNFMGEMLLRGTQSRNKEQLDTALDQMGARLEVETRTDALILRGAVLKSQLTPFLDLVSEVLTAPSFPQSEIKKLKSEVISGILEELGQDSALASRHFVAQLFQGHPYGSPILGRSKDVESFKREQIVSQYDRLIRSAKLLVLGTGDAVPERIQDWGRILSVARPSPEVDPVPRLTAPKDAKTRRLLIVDKPDRTQTQINAGQIGILMTDARFFPLYVGNYAYGGPSFSSRLMTEVRVKRGWSYGADSHFRFGREPRSWQIHLFPAEKDTAAALELTLRMTSELKASGITQGEFDFSKESLINSAGFMYNTPRKRVENLLLEKTLNLPDGFMKSYALNITKVKLSDVNSALGDFLKPENFAITVVGTAAHLKESLSRASGVPLDQVKVVPYTQE